MKNYRNQIQTNVTQEINHKMLHTLFYEFKKMLHMHL